MSRVAHQCQSLFQFLYHEATKVGIFYSPLDGMLIHCRVSLSIEFVGTQLYTWVERGTMKVKKKSRRPYPRTQCNVPARAWTWTNVYYSPHYSKHVAFKVMTTCMFLTAVFAWLHVALQVMKMNQVLCCGQLPQQDLQSISKNKRVPSMPFTTLST